MKCLVLAGGSSDRLWPLSRRDYPKQFMEIREDRSMFQDTILRNIPFCEEFVIITSKRHENVVKGQLTAFQDLTYTIISEEVPTKAALPVIVCLQQCEPDEEILIVTTDCIIEGDYYTPINKLKDAVKNGEFAVLVCKQKTTSENYNYISVGKKLSFGAKPSKSAMVDVGVWGGKAEVLLNAFDKNLVEKCSKITFKRNVLEREDAEAVEAVGLTKAVTTHTFTLVDSDFEWTRITDISSFYNYYDTVLKNNNNAISNNCNKIEIINTVDEQLVIANGLKNVVIVNTRDAIYVTNSTNESDIKAITDKYGQQKKSYFNQSPKIYETWGMEELIGAASDCKVKIITVFPKSNYEFKLKKNAIINFFVSQGRATLEVDDAEFKYRLHENITLCENKKYVISNHSRYPLVMVATEKLLKPIKSKISIANNLVRLKPVFKDNLWGGTKIRDYLGKDVGDMEVIAESWELSAHPAGESIIAEGSLKGRTFTKYLDSIGKEKLGWKAQNYERFPIMVKFIDAKDNLSVQVHPADEYAMSVEGDYGKNEMWYILDADEDSYIYVGFNKDVTAEEIRERIANNTLVSILNKVPVQKGETYFLKAGTVHAIGSGCFICEVQQSSNITYRLFDYGRKDKNGQERELHIDKALDVLDMKASNPKASEVYESVMNHDFVKRLIGQCKYFTVTQYFVDGECAFPESDSSFQVFVVIQGTGTVSDGINTYSTKLGDTWFCTSKQIVAFRGRLKILTINI